MKEIKELLDSFSGKVYNLCFEILSCSKDDATVFEFVCKNFRTRQKEETREIEEYFSENEIEEIESAYGDVVNGLLNSTMKKCNAGLIDPNDFYKVLWHSYSVNFSTLKEKAFALYYTIIDTAIPYQYLGKPVSMGNERFQELLKENKSSIDKILYIKRSNYSQRTERASLLLNCLDEIEDLESKAVVLAYAIKAFAPEDKSSNPMSMDELLKQLEKKLDELGSEDDEECSD